MRVHKELLSTRPLIRFPFIIHCEDNRLIEALEFGIWASNDSDSVAMLPMLYSPHATGKYGYDRFCAATHLLDFPTPRILPVIFSYTKRPLKGKRIVHCLLNRNQGRRLN